ncbi:MAG: collagen-like protein [Archangium sp.]|nr:collagen-like protein [Archangium sp.]
MGTQGVQGTPGQQGTQGATGIQGPPGPAGMVLVIDGGVVTGPPGAAVLTSPLPVGDSVCTYGGVMVTQLIDAGVTRICNGAPGAQGPQGPQGQPGQQGAQGPQGMTGMTGAQGPQGMTGMTGPQGAQGAQGPQGLPGAQGPQGLPGAQGPQGATGPQGPAGAVLYVDGGIVVVQGNLGTGAPTFAGITSFTTNGAPMGPSGQAGRLSMNAYCNAEYPGSHICNEFEWAEATPYDPVPSSGAWIEYATSTNHRSLSAGCNNWTNNSATSGYGRLIATSTGGILTSPASHTCATVLPVACCRSRTSAIFRGITSYVTDGAPTGPSTQAGRLSMNARCRAEFPGSHICNEFEWAEATPYLPVPASGAWIEYATSTNNRSLSAGCNNWTNNGATSGYGRLIANNTGGILTSPASHTCATVLPLACCE